MPNLSNQTFIDGVGDIRMHDGIVRIDMLALSPTGLGDDGQPSAEFVDQLVMSPAAFLRMVSAMGATVRQMQERGLIGDAPAAEPATDGAAAPSGMPEPSAGRGKREKPASPNF